MNFKTLEGKWTGSFKYGKCYPEEFAGKTETFQLDIVFDGNNFRGTCTDRFTELNFNEPATVEGSFVPNLISFIKRYPGELYLDDDNNLIANRSKPSIPIHYTGFYYRGLFSRKIRFEGEWVIQMTYPEENGKKTYYTFDGTWSMAKVK